MLIRLKVKFKKIVKNRRTNEFWIFIWSKIFLTDLGKKLFAKDAPASAQRYADIEEKYGVRKLELLYELLDDLIKTLEEDDTWLN